MTPDQIKALLDYILGYALKYVPASIAAVIKSAADNVLPGLLSQLVGNLTPADIVKQVLSTIAGTLTGHPVAVWFLTNVVEPWIIKELPKLLVMHQTNPEHAVFECTPFSLVVYPCVD